MIRGTWAPQTGQASRLEPQSLTRAAALRPLRVRAWLAKPLVLTKHVSGERNRGKVASVFSYFHAARPTTPMASSAVA